MWYRVALSSIGDAVLVTNREGRVSFMNPAAQAVITGAAVDTVLAADDVANVQAIVDQA